MDFIVRKASRAILLTPDNEVLLIFISNPSAAWQGWITPGGGIDTGETDLSCLKRELDEELGLKDIPEAVAIWSRYHEFEWNFQSYKQNEVFFLIRTPKFEPSRARLTIAESIDFKVMRWWKLGEIKESNDCFAPVHLYNHLVDLIAKGPQNKLITVL